MYIVQVAMSALFSRPFDFKSHLGALEGSMASAVAMVARQESAQVKDVLKRGVLNGFARRVEQAIYKVTPEPPPPGLSHARARSHGPLCLIGSCVKIYLPREFSLFQQRNQGQN